jgi:hypothetical protein
LFVLPGETPSPQKGTRFVTENADASEALTFDPQTAGSLLVSLPADKASRYGEQHGCGWRRDKGSSAA